MAEFLAEVKLRKYVTVEVDALTREDAWDIFYMDIADKIKDMYPDLEIGEVLMYRDHEYRKEYKIDRLDDLGSLKFEQETIMAKPIE